MKETVLRLWDDVEFRQSGARVEADETITLSLDGRYAEVDLTADRAKAVREFLAPYFDAAQPPSDPASTAGAAVTTHTRLSRAYGKAMRAFAAAQRPPIEVIKNSGGYYYSAVLRRRFADHLAATGEVIE